MSYNRNKELNYSMSRVSLCSLKPGSSAVVITVPEHPLLSSLGLRPGKKVQCRGRQLFGGPLLIETGERQVALGMKIAEKVMIDLV